jgi:tetratricopeptide (TPR) repeat protein
MEVITTVQPMVEDALRLDPRLPDAHAALSLARYLERRFDEAEAAAREALVLSPNHVNANNWLHIALAAQGRLREAHEQALKVHQLDPLYVPGVGNVAFGYVVMGMPERVESLTERVLPFLEGSARDYVQGVRAFGLGQRGESARAIQIVENLPDPTQAYAGAAAYFSHLGLSAYESALPYSPNRAARMLALSRLDRVEEALQVGQEFVAIGEGISETIQVLADHQRFEDIITFVESNLGSAQRLAELHPNDGFGADELGHLAHAYRRVDQDDKAAATLALFRASLERQAGEGVDNGGLSWSRAHLAMLEGDADAALAHLDRAVTQGYWEDNDFVRYWTVFRPLLGDPRFDALIVRMNDLRNEQRVLLDLPSLELDA